MFGSKGKLELKLESKNFREGEKITGSVWLNLNQPLMARELRVIFHCYKRVRNHGSDSHGHSNPDNITTLHKEKISLAGEKEYITSNYPFSITIPTGLIQEEKEITRGGIIGFLKKSAQKSKRDRTSFHWGLNSSLDIPKGFDLHQEVRLNVSK